MADSGIESLYLKYTLDVGHANAMGEDYRSFRDSTDVQIVHLHTNDGESDSHNPFPGYRCVVNKVDAPYTFLR